MKQGGNAGGAESTGAAVKLCKRLNRFFKLPVHPFNLENAGAKTYARWQFEKGADTIRYYLDKTTSREMFENRQVLDIGCGAAGKTLYYAAQGVSKIYGMDIVPRYETMAEALAEETGLADRFEFVLGDAAALPFDNDHFDTILMNDAMEHVEQPLKVLKECFRVLKPGGRLYVNFPPYHHPYGAHLSDAIGIPWVHLLFSEKTLIQVYTDLVRDLPDGPERIGFRISTDSSGRSYFSYINRMTVKKFSRILKDTDFSVFYYREVPLRRGLKLLSRTPGIREAFVRMVVCILQKCS
ncbi:MAG TPA: class I SAM-dependent methyltransferase [Clostridiales bacterium]|nr:class I SAM-dependent methyltransferase [Clostridiales bacterium]